MHTLQMNTLFIDNNKYIYDLNHIITEQYISYIINNILYINAYGILCFSKIVDWIL